MAETRQHSTRLGGLAVGPLFRHSIQSECQNPVGSSTAADTSTSTTTVTSVAPQPDETCSSSRCRCRCSNSKRSGRKHATSNSGTSSELITKPVSIQLVSLERPNKEITAFIDGSLSITQHTKTVTSCQLVKDSHVVTSSMDTDCKTGKLYGTVQVWIFTASAQQHLIKTLRLSSPVHKAICVTDRSDETQPYLILAGTDSGHLVICRLTLTRDKYTVTLEENKTMQLHAPNPLTALAISSDQRHLVTGSQYVAFDFIRTHHNSSLCGGSKLDRRTRGTVKTWNWVLLRASQSNADQVVTCSRTDRQLMSSMTSEREAGYGVTSLTLCEDSSLLAVGLSSIGPPASSQSSSHSSSSSSSAAAAAVVVVCNREKMETLWIADNLKSSCVHDAVFRRQQDAWNLFITTDTTVELLHLTEKMALQKTGLTMCRASATDCHYIIRLSPVDLSSVTLYW